MIKTNINRITSNLLEKKLRFEAEVVKVNPKQPHLHIAIFECRSCKLYYVRKAKKIAINEPIVCQECGGRSFKLLKNESKYGDMQKIKVKDTNNFIDKYNRQREPQTIDCIVFNKNVNQHIKEDKVKITGTLKLDQKNKEYVEVSGIRLLKKTT